MSRRRSLLSREAGSLISHTKILRLLLDDAGRGVPPEVNAALLTFEGWAVSLIAAEINQPLWPSPEPSMLMAEIRSVLAAMPDGGWSASCATCHTGACTRCSTSCAATTERRTREERIP